MKVYGYTYISSEDLGNGYHTETEIYINREERNDRVYRRYISEQSYLNKEELLSCEYDRRPKEDIINDFDGDGHLRLVYGENFVQFEAFERNL